MFEIHYYTKENSCPVLNYFKTLSKKDLAKILRDIDLLSEYGYHLGMPHTQKMKGVDDIWELRVKISSNNYRIFYFTFRNNAYMILHGFLKKTSKTPRHELNTAIRRKNEYLERND